MTNLQLYIAVGLPTVAVLSSLIISLVRISALREEMRAQYSALREDIPEIRSDIKLLTGNVYELMGQK